jgi:hypothetical protein
MNFLLLLASTFSCLHWIRSLKKIGIGQLFYTCDVLEIPSKYILTLLAKIGMSLFITNSF